MTNNQESLGGNDRFGHGEEKKADRYLVLRNILNIIFMIGALIGVIVYFQGNQDTGTIIILVAMVFKIVECIFRFMK